MDRLDFQALQLMVRQGRITWAELAPQLGLSAPAAAERVRRLEEKGMIKGYGAVLDRDALGYGLTAFVGTWRGWPARYGSRPDRAGRRVRHDPCRSPAL